MKNAKTLQHAYDNPLKGAYRQRMCMACRQAPFYLLFDSTVTKQDLVNFYAWSFVQVVAIDGTVACDHCFIQLNMKVELKQSFSGLHNSVLQGMERSECKTLGLISRLALVW